jgi:WD40 repeat protein
VVIGPDDQTIAAADEWGNIYFWHRPRAEDEPARLWSAAHWRAHEKPIRSLVFAADARDQVVISGGDDGLIKFWSMASRKPARADLSAQGRRICCLAVSPDGKMLAAATSDGVVETWDLASGRSLQEFEKPRDATEPYEIHAVEFTSDSRYLAVASSETAIRILWVDGSGKQRLLSGHSDPVKALTRGSDRWLLSAGQDGTVLEWDHTILGRNSASGLKKDDAFKSRMGFRDLKPLSAISASGDGRFAVTGGANGLVQLWEGEELVLVAKQFPGHSSYGQLRAVDVASDGSSFVTADSSTILLWPGPQKWADIICSKLLENISRKEWQSAMPDIPYVEQCPGLPVPD